MTLSFRPVFVPIFCNCSRPSDLITQTQTRLATGKRVNSALDNPINFFTAQGLSVRANDLNALLDSMSTRHQHHSGRQQRHHGNHQAGAIGPGACQPGAADRRYDRTRRPGQLSSMRLLPPNRPARRRLRLQRHQPARRQRSHHHAERRRHLDCRRRRRSTTPPPATWRSTPRPITGRPAPILPPPAPS